MISLVMVAKAKKEVKKTVEEKDGKKIEKKVRVSNRKIAENLGVSRNTINAAVRKIEDTGLTFEKAAKMKEEDLRRLTRKKRVDDSFLMPNFEAVMIKYRKRKNRTQMYNDYCRCCSEIGEKAYSAAQFYQHFNDYVFFHPEALKRRRKKTSCVWKLAKVQDSSHVAYDNRYYSVPYHFIGCEVVLKVGSRKLTVYSGGVVLTEHKLPSVLSKDDYVTDLHHLPPDSAHYGKWNSTRYLAWARFIGPYTYKLISMMFDTSDFEQRRYKSVHAILGLSSKYGDIRLEKACKETLSQKKLLKYRNVLENLEKDSSN